MISQTKPLKIKYFLSFNFAITTSCVAIRLAENRTRMGGIQFRLSPSINEVLKKGDAAFYLSTDDPMITCKYWSLEDRASGRQKVVYMLLTCHEPMMLDLCNRHMEDKIIKKPAAVKHYILRMGGIYVCIKMTSSYIICIFPAKYINGIENLHSDLYHRLYQMFTRYV